MKVRRIFTTEDTLHVSSVDHWNSSRTFSLEPYSGNFLCEILFYSSNIGMHYGYVIIEMDNIEIVIPVEIISQTDAVHKITEEVNFGNVISSIPTKNCEIWAQNVGFVPLRVIGISTQHSDAGLILRSKIGLLLLPLQKTLIANATYLAPKSSNAEINDWIVIKYQVLTPEVLTYSTTYYIPTLNTNNPFRKEGSDSSIILIPYHVRILNGSLDYDKKFAYFSLRGPKDKDAKVADSISDSYEREFYISNGFQVPITVYNVSISSRAFTIETFPHNETQHPSCIWSSILIRFFPFKYTERNSKKKPIMRISTNATIIRIPLHVFGDDFPFIKTIPSHSLFNRIDNRQMAKLDLGSLFPNSLFNVSLFIKNNGPLRINILDYECSIPSVDCELIPAINTAGSTSSSSNKKISIPPDDVSSFILSIYTGRYQASNITGELTIYSSSFEDKDMILSILDITFSYLHGEIIFSPSYLSFVPIYPSMGIIDPSLISIKSTYSSPIVIKGWIQSDRRIVTNFWNKSLLANSSTDIGTISLDPSRISPNENYMKYLKYLSLSKNIELTSSDVAFFEKSLSLWHSLSNGEDTLFNSSYIDFVLSSEYYPSSLLLYRYNVTISSYFPSVAKVKEIHFDLVELGSSHSVYLTINNPSPYPIWIESIPNNSPFSLLTIPNIRSHSNNNRIYLFPYTTLDIGTIVFSPSSLGAISAPLYLRNNLTGLSKILLSGVGGKGTLLSTFIDDSGCTLFNRVSLTWNISRLNFTKTRRSYRMHSNISTYSHYESLLFGDFSIENNGRYSSTLSGIRFSDGECNDGEVINRLSKLGVKLFESPICYSLRGFFILSYVDMPYIIPPESSISFTLGYVPDYSIRYDSDNIIFETHSRISKSELSVNVEASFPYSLLTLFSSLLPFSIFDKIMNLFVFICLFGLFWILINIIKSELRPISQSMKPEITDESAGSLLFDTKRSKTTNIKEDKIKGRKEKKSNKEKKLSTRSNLNLSTSELGLRRRTKAPHILSKIPIPPREESTVTSINEKVKEDSRTSISQQNDENVKITIMDKGIKNSIQPHSSERIETDYNMNNTSATKDPNIHPFPSINNSSFDNNANNMMTSSQEDTLLPSSKSLRKPKPSSIDLDVISENINPSLRDALQKIDMSLREEKEYMKYIEKEKNYAEGSKEFNEYGDTFISPEEDDYKDDEIEFLSQADEDEIINDDIIRENLFWNKDDTDAVLHSSPVPPRSIEESSPSPNTILSELQRKNNSESYYSNNSYFSSYFASNNDSDESHTLSKPLFFSETEYNPFDTSPIHYAPGTPNRSSSKSFVNRSFFPLMNTDIYPSNENGRRSSKSFFNRSFFPSQPNDAGIYPSDEINDLRFSFPQPQSNRATILNSSMNDEILYNKVPSSSKSIYGVIGQKKLSHLPAANVAEPPSDTRYHNNWNSTTSSLYQSSLFSSVPVSDTSYSIRSSTHRSSPLHFQHVDSSNSTSDHSLPHMPSKSDNSYSDSNTGTLSFPSNRSSRVIFKKSEIN